MNKTFKQLLLIAGAVIIVSGCGHKHSFADSTCTTPMTCTECGETEGEAKGHTWEDATCEVPQICKECGATEGAAKGHDWAEATCDKPKTCSVCNATEGEPIEHSWKPATFETPKHCENCGLSEGGILVLEEFDLNKYGSHDGVRLCGDKIALIDWDEDWNVFFKVCDYDGNEICSYVIDTIGVGIWEMVTQGTSSGIVNAYVDWSGYEDDETYLYITLTNYQGERLATTKKVINDFEAAGYVDCWEIYGEDVCEVYLYDKYIGAYDLKNYVWLSESEREQTVTENDKYQYYNPTLSKNTLVNTFDDLWGYLDSDGNEIAMYKDATDFISAGYALVSNGGNKYDLIDEDFNVLGKDIITAEGAYVSDYLSEIFVCKTGNSWKYYRIVTSDIDAASAGAEGSNEEKSIADSENDESQVVEADDLINAVSIDKLQVNVTMLGAGTTLKSTDSMIEIVYWIHSGESTKMAAIGDSYGWLSLTIGENLTSFVNGYTEEDILKISEWKVSEIEKQSDNKYSISLTAEE
ncbi:MAG: WG repeat-containing protein [Lachnospiraceae bacterium]|nr:WG repeat-containing protein [Lachnospiraceae bacterium]